MRVVAERKGNPFLRSSSGGRILSAMMLPQFMLVPPAGFGVLTTTGRRSGKARRKCIRAIRDGDEVYVVSIRPTAWLKNVQANPHVTLRIRGGTFTGVARELREPGERARAMDAYCNSVKPFDYSECMMWRRGRPSASKIKDLHRTWFDHGVPLVVELNSRLA